MAYTKRFYSDYKSYNDTDYHLEIWIDGNTTAASEITLGTGGPVISYDTDNEERFNTILSSKMTIPIVVKGTAMEVFVTDLRDTYEEQQVYVYLYQSTAADEAPLWGGYVLMDLGSKEDIAKPYDVIITATDGLALLKDRDWVGVGATKPYDQNDMYWGPGRFTYWISQALLKTGIGGTAEGAYVDAEFRTSVDWYNADHEAPSQSNDPLYNTKGKMSWSHTQDQQGTFKVSTTYEILKAILKVWGCRIVYWKHVFWIIQISEYNTANGGTFLNPENIPTRIYYLSSGQNGDLAYIGDKDQTRYQLAFDLTTPTEGIQKLTGSKYDFYARLKTVTGDFITGGGHNYYGGFPTRSLTGPSAGAFVGTMDQGTIIDASGAGELYLRIPLICTRYNDPPPLGTHTVTFYFDLKATDGVTTRWLTYDFGTYSWETTQPTFGLTQQDFRPRGTFTLSEPPTWAVQGGVTVPQPSQPELVDLFNGVLPTHSDFDGPWDFSIIMDDTYWTTNNVLSSVFIISTTGGLSYNPALGIFWTNVPSGFNVTTLNYSMLPGNINFNTSLGNPYDGDLMCLSSSGGVNIYGESVMLNTGTTDSEIKRVKVLRWGDTIDITDLASLQVWNGSAWIQTDFNGEWGEGALTGNESLTFILLTQVLGGQASNIQILNTRIATSVNGKTETDGTYTAPKYINPVGRIRETITGQITNLYVFRRGTFYTLMDEWDYEGWVIKDDDPTTTNETTTIYGYNSPVLDDSTVLPRMANPNPDPNSMARDAFFTLTTSVLSGATTSIPIEQIGTALFVAGDKIMLIAKGRALVELEINATQLSDAEELTIVSYDFGADGIDIGALITHSEKDLITQYQNKTRGTVGGMNVSASRLGPLESDGNIVGVDAARIHILPTDFMINDDAETPLVWKDSSTSGVQVTTSTSEPIAFVRIPYGKSATLVDVWGSANKDVEVYEGLINENFNLTTAPDLAGGTGEMNTQITLTSAVDSSAFNYLIIRVKLSTTSQRIWGGMITIIDI